MITNIPKFQTIFYFRRANTVLTLSLRSIIKAFLRPLAKISPIPLTKGQRIDHLSRRIIRQYCQPTSNCIDVGAHKGEILDLIIESSPEGQHFAFEPLPHLYQGLKKKYGKSIQLFDCALSDETGMSTFHYVITNPAYSGIKKRRYDRKHEEVREIQVELKRMDDCVPESTPIDFIKIDVEGAELHTLRGAERILSSNQPLLLFEHGLGGADSYQYGAKELWQFLSGHNYAIHTLKGYLKNQDPLTLPEMIAHFEKGDEFYFVGC